MQTMIAPPPTVRPWNAAEIRQHILVYAAAHFFGGKIDRGI